MNKMKKFISMIMASSILVTLFGGVQHASAEETVSMTVWIGKTFNPDADAYLEERIKSFAEVNPRIKEITVESFPGTDAMVKYSAAIESGDVPDVTFMSADVYNSFVALGVLTELDDVVETVENSYSPIVENVKNNLTIGGHIYSIPLYNNANMLTYRTDIFDEAGIKEPPKTWKELKETCEVLMDSTDLYPFGHAISNSDDSETANQWILRSFGGRYWDEEGNVIVNSQETIDAINYVVDLYNSGYIPKSAVEWDSSGNNTSYLGEESAMVINLTTLYNSVTSGDYADTLGKNTAVCALPLGDYQTWKEPGTNMLSIFKDAKYPDLSKELLRFIIDAEWYTSYMDMMYPVSVPVYEESTQAGVWESELGQELVKQSTLENMYYGYPCNDVAVARADAQAQRDFLLSKTLLRVILNGESAEDSVAQLEQELISLKAEMEAQTAE